jgi:hypothetical protein
MTKGDDGITGTPDPLAAVDTKAYSAPSCSRTVSEEWVRRTIKLAIAAQIQALAAHVSVETTMRYMQIANAAPTQESASENARSDG